MKFGISCPCFIVKIWIKTVLSGEAVGLDRDLCVKDVFIVQFKFTDDTFVPPNSTS